MSWMSDETRSTGCRDGKIVGCSHLPSTCGQVKELNHVGEFVVRNDQHCMTGLL